MNEMIEKIVGFDLGHGETALCSVDVSDPTEPRALEIQPGIKSIITAVAEDRTRGVVIGDQALTGDVTNLRIGFKSARLNDPDVRLPLLTFVRKVVASLIEQRQIGSAPTCQFLVGCPSGWDRTTTVPAYEALLREAGLANVRVVPESRAAFLSTGMQRKELAGSVLIVDIGSSTTDFTVVSGFKERPVDFGDISLGASLIDLSLLAIALRESADRAAVEQALKEDPTKSRLAELAARRVKETYFKSPDDYVSKPCFVPHVVSRTPRLYLEFNVDKRVMDEALAMPQPSLGGRSWLKCFDDGLSEARRQLGHSVDRVLVTGGPSRMRFVMERTEAMFGKQLVVRGQEPELAIARGLAIAGRIDSQSRQFRATIDQFIANGRIRKVVEKHLPGFRASVVKVTVDQLQRIVMEKAEDWQARRNGMFRLDQLEGAVVTTLANWMKSSQGQSALAGAVATWSRVIERDIGSDLVHIADRFHLDRDALRLKLLPPSLGDVGGKLRPINPDDLTKLEGIGGIVVLVGTIIAGTIAGGTGTALIMSGPIGWIIGAVAGLIAFSVGTQWVTDKVNSADLPTIVRGLISLDSIASDLAAKRPELETKLAEALTEAAFGQLVSQVESEIRANLEEKAREAELLIS